MHVKIDLNNDTRLALALKRAPKELVRGVAKAVKRGGNIGAREAKREAPKAESTLTNSIRAQQLTQLHTQIHTSTHYDGYVHEGTEKGGWVPLDTMLEWVRVKKIKPRNPKYDQRDLVYLIRRKIYEQGTPPNPFMQRAQKTTEPLFNQVVNDNIDKALARVGL